jgi:hypothetical protein
MSFAALFVVADRFGTTQRALNPEEEVDNGPETLTIVRERVAIINQSSIHRRQNRRVGRCCSGRAM